jgi:hypothetical protein
MPSNYWSCSKLADWLRGIPKPRLATPEEWARWEQQAQTKKFRYWLAEHGLDGLQQVIYSPFRFLRGIFNYLHNRWIMRTHALTSKLKRGQWYDFDMRLLHAAFDEFVNFVETELAWEHLLASENNDQWPDLAWYQKLLPIGCWRSPEAGIAYLNWAATVQYKDDCNDQSHAKAGQYTP